jgi:uncharacterized protein (TIGR02246 family)
MQSDEQQIRDLVTEWQSAAAAGDLSRLLPLMAEDAIFLIAGQAPMRGRDAFAAAFRAGVGKIRIQSTSKVEELQVVGNLAYSCTYLEVTMMPLQSGSSMRRSGYTLTLFRKEPDGRWVLFRDANMLTPEDSTS